MTKCYVTDQLRLNVIHDANYVPPIPVQNESDLLKKDLYPIFHRVITFCHTFGVNITAYVELICVGHGVDLFSFLLVNTYLPANSSRDPSTWSACNYL